MARLPAKGYMAFLRKHYDLIPLLSAVGFAGAMGIGMIARSALKNPDVSWNKAANPEPWNKINQDERFKFLDSNQVDYKGRHFPPQRPSMANDTYKNI